MSNEDVKLLERITVDPEKMNGKPTIRGMRFPVQDIIGMIRNGMSPAQIVEEHPSLELEDIDAALVLAMLKINDISHTNANAA